jgi:hypothetical protein
VRLQFATLFVGRLGLSAGLAVLYTEVAFLDRLAMLPTKVDGQCGHSRVQASLPNSCVPHWPRRDPNRESLDGRRVHANHIVDAQIRGC